MSASPWWAPSWACGGSRPVTTVAGRTWLTQCSASAAIPCPVSPVRLVWCSPPVPLASPSLQWTWMAWKLTPITHSLWKPIMVSQEWDLLHRELLQLSGSQLDMQVSRSRENFFLLIMKRKRNLCEYLSFLHILLLPHVLVWYGIIRILKYLCLWQVKSNSHIPCNSK